MSLQDIFKTQQSYKTRPEIRYCENCVYLKGIQIYDNDRESHTQLICNVGKFDILPKATCNIHAFPREV